MKFTLLHSLLIEQALIRQVYGTQLLGPIIQKYVKIESPIDWMGTGCYLLAGRYVGRTETGFGKRLSSHLLECLPENDTSELKNGVNLTKCSIVLGLLNDDTRIDFRVLSFFTSDEHDLITSLNKTHKLVNKKGNPEWIEGEKWKWQQDEDESRLRHGFVPVC